MDDWLTKTGWEASQQETIGGVVIRGLDDFPVDEIASRVPADRVIREEMGLCGVRALFAENALWTVLWVFLYWDEIFAKLPGSYEPFPGPEFPAPGNDIPRNLFREDFLVSHRRLYEARRKQLENGDLAKLLLDARWRNRHSWTRLVEDSDRFEEEELVAVLSLLPRHAVLRVLDRLWHNYGAYRRGFPDLLVLDPGPRLVEVKGPKDRLAPEQATWLNYLNGVCGLPCELLTIGWSPRKLANVRKVLSAGN